MNGFERVSPESVGIPSERIMEFLRGVTSVGVEMHSFMLLRYGKVCAEGWWTPYAADIPHSMFSFSKSVTATAIGFAEQEGLLRLDEKLVDIFSEFVPENPGENLKAADIYSLLTMSCGQAQELTNEEQNRSDWIRVFFSKAFPYPPGTVFQYNTGGSNLLSAILQRRTGQTVTAYLRQRLFEPLGLSDIFCYALSDGTERGGFGFLLKTEDMARFTQFYLQRGV